MLFCSDNIKFIHISFSSTYLSLGSLQYTFIMR